MDPFGGTLSSATLGQRRSWRARLGGVVRERRLTTVALGVAALAAILASVALAP
jgi:hypothetical protein